MFSSSLLNSKKVLLGKIFLFSLFLGYIWKDWGNFSFFHESKMLASNCKICLFNIRKPSVIIVIWEQTFPFRLSQRTCSFGKIAQLLHQRANEAKYSAKYDVWSLGGSRGSETTDFASHSRLYCIFLKLVAKFSSMYQYLLLSWAYNSNMLRCACFHSEFASVYTSRTVNPR